MNESKEDTLKEIEELLKIYDEKINFDSYILEYLSIQELENIKINIQKRQENIIKDNHEWLQGFLS